MNQKSGCETETINDDPSPRRRASRALTRIGLGQRETADTVPVFNDMPAAVGLVQLATVVGPVDLRLRMRLDNALESCCTAHAHRNIL